MSILGWILVAFVFFKWCPTIPALALGVVALRYLWILARGVFRI